MVERNNHMLKTPLGTWSAGLNVVFSLIVLVSVFLVKVLGILDFNDRWWDITVATLVPIELVAFITGIIAMLKHKDRSGLVVLSVVTGIAGILFVLLHSLFISD